MAKKEQDFGINSAKVDSIKTKEFFDDYLRLYSGQSNIRGIPFIGDGLKESHRKALWGMLSRGENAGLISVERVSAHCAAETNYHHGIISMQGAIVNLAQNFAGSNNVNFLVPEGQFGSRLSHSAASARYIETTLSENFRKIFKKDDDLITVQRVEGTTKIEPKYFIPILPVMLINGAEGVGTGHSCKIFSYDPIEIRNVILDILNGKKPKPNSIIPFWNGFKGKRERLSNGQVVVYGDLEIVNTTEIKITELPVGMQSDKFEEILYKLEDRGLIKSFKNASEVDSFEFTVKVPRTTTALPMEELIKIFKLESRDTENLTIWDSNGSIKKYNCVEEIIEEFIEWRLERYEERRQKLISICKDQIDWYNELIRFIEFYLDNSQKFKNTGKKDLIEILQSNDFKNPDRLLSMSIWTLTKDYISELTVKLNKEIDKLDKLNKDNAKSMYIRELKELKFENNEN